MLLSCARRENKDTKLDKNTCTQDYTLGTNKKQVTQTKHKSVKLALSKYHTQSKINLNVQIMSLF